MPAAPQPPAAREQDKAATAARASHAAILGPNPEETPEDFNAFAHEPPFRPRRNWAKIWTMVAVAAALLMLAATAAIGIWGLPANLGGGFAFAKARGTALQIVDHKTQRSRMESGNELLTVTGRVVNPSGETQRVPALRAELRDAGGRAIYNWVISAPVAQLSPGASATFNSAEVGVPPGAKAVNISFAPAG
jgi:hypothetical protein